MSAGLMLLVASAAPAQSVGARGVVASLHEVLLGVMREADALGFPGRYERLAPVLMRGFDLPYIIRVILRKQWKGLDEAQRAEVTDTFTRLTVATYAGRFDGYDGERFKIVAEKPLKRGRMLVRSQLRKTDGKVVRLDYVLHRADGGWRIVNVVADGVSELALKRAEYGSIIGAEGFDALIEKIDVQIASYGADA